MEGGKEKFRRMKDERPSDHIIKFTNSEVRSKGRKEEGRNTKYQVIVP